MKALMACAALALSGCFATPGPVVREKPPANLLADCPMPTVYLTHNGGLAQGIGRLRDSIKNCNDDKKALREWAEGIQ